MRFSEQEIQRRKPVWVALSDLFLDTEKTDSDHRIIAQTLLDSGFSDSELGEILWTEVFPVCIHNLLHVAGEWMGFGDDWLVGRILATPRRWWRQYRFLQPHRGMIEGSWTKVMGYVSESRKSRERSGFGP